LNPSGAEQPFLILGPVAKARAAFQETRSKGRFCFKKQPVASLTGAEQPARAGLFYPVRESSLARDLVQGPVAS